MDQRAFLGIFEPVRNKMYRMSLRLLISREAAEDAVQETLMKLWEKRKKLSSYRSPEAFAMTVAKNHCLDQLKLKQNQNLRIVHNNYEENNPSLQKQVETKDEYGLIRLMREELPEKQKLVVQLHDIEEYDYAEIAEIMEMNETAVRVTLSRARKKLKEGLQKKHNYGTV